MGRTIDGEYTVLDEDGFEAGRARVAAGFWPKLRRFARALPFVEDVVAAYYCAMDARTPIAARLALLGALAYFIMPVDAVPDVLVGLGMADDIAVLGAVLRRFGQEIRPEHRDAAREALRE
jgi:uncharacterized membrane protein YkvA (DUF1232 family)